MQHWGLVPFVLFGFIMGTACEDWRNPSSRQSGFRRELDYKRNMKTLVETIRALSREESREDGPPSLVHSRSTMSLNRMAFNNSNMDAYFTVFSSLFSLYHPVLFDSFIEALPEALICVLADKQLCGWQGDLASSVSSALTDHVVSLASSIKAQSCTSTSKLRISNSSLNPLNSIPEMLANVLSSDLLFYLASDSFASLWNGLMDITLHPFMSFMSDVLLNGLQTPLDFVKLGLQFVISIPQLNQTGTCQQGDLKQLIMWGLSHNVSWSFGKSLLDMFLAHQSPSCSSQASDCQTTASIQLSRTGLPSVGLPSFSLTCEQNNFNLLNETLCADALTSPDSSILYQTCETLSTLSQAEVTQVWKNMCHTIQNIFLPLIESCSESSSSAPEKPRPRVSRSTLSLNELLCDYKNWTIAGTVDPGLVTMCSENDRTQFIIFVCNDADTMQVLLNNPVNTWVWEFCANTSSTSVVSLYCSYNLWTAETTDPSIVTFCWNNDMMQFQTYLCQNSDLYTIVFSNEENSWLMLNCSGPPSQMSNNSQSCNYSQWWNIQGVQTSQFSFCIQNDEARFLQDVCGNQTFLSAVLLNTANAWIGLFCTSSVTDSPITATTLKTQAQCDYESWMKFPVDPSVVVLCWRFNQTDFRHHVCRNASLFETLTLQVENQWLLRECHRNDTVTMLAQVCVYSEWSQSVFVASSILSLCAGLDAENFSRLVCANLTILYNLLANVDNIWLLKECANRTAGAPGNVNNPSSFQIAEECGYSSWAETLPDPELLALCWGYDQVNFITNVCTDFSMLSRVTQNGSSLWIGTFCAIYTNVTANTTNVQPCLAKEVAVRLNWTCNVDFGTVCQPGVSETQGLLMLMLCGMEKLQPRLESLMDANVSSVVEQATSVLVVLLLTLEDTQMTSLRVAESVGLSVLETVVGYMENETSFENKRVILQCFANLLSSLLQTGRAKDLTPFLIKEYFAIPASELRSVLSAADISIVKEILIFYNMNYSSLQVTDDYLQTLVSVLFEVFLPRDNSLCLDMGHLLTLATTSDIMSMPHLQNNVNVLSIINFCITNLSQEQQQAFGQLFSQSVSLSNTTVANSSFIRDISNLIAFLPYQSFQHFSPAQLLDGLDVLMKVALSPLKELFIAQSIIGTYSNLTADQFRMLGNLTCLADPSQLLAYAGTDAFPVIQNNIRTCVIDGLSVSSNMISDLVLNASELQYPSSLSPQRVAQLAPFLPGLGCSFLEQLSSVQLLPALGSLTTVPFSAPQAGVIMDKLSPYINLAQPGSLAMLGSLVTGVKVETLQSLPSDVLLEALPNISLQTPGLTPPQANAIISKLWSSSSVIIWMDKVEDLLSGTPLICVIPISPLLLVRDTRVNTRLWNTQQAKVLFKQATRSLSSLSQSEFLSLGTIAPGVNCTDLSRLFQNQSSLLPLLDILTFLREQPLSLHPTLKKCLIEELYYLKFFPDLIGDLGAQIALSLPMSTIKKFAPDKMEVLREMILQDPHYFLLLPSTKQAVLVDRMVQRLDLYTGVYTQEEFYALGVMATFVTDEMFFQLDRSFFVDALEFLQGFCYSASKRNLVADMLQEPKVFGAVQTWTSEILDQVGRLLLFLPKESIQQIPLALMSLERIERLLMSEQKWEEGEFGSLCQNPSELFDTEQFVLQYFIGFSRARSIFAGLIPTCEMLRATQPSTWSIDSIKNMPATEFQRCLEIIGQDPLFTSSQLSVLLKKTKEVYGMPSSYTPSVISQLGRIATQISPEELTTLKLTEIQPISALGAIYTWTSKQMKSLFSSVLISTRKTAKQLDSSSLVALGYLICGIETPVLRSLNPVEFSKAVLWLGQLRLSCSEEQLDAMIGLVSQDSTFGLVSSWGPEIFMEIGALAAGLPDMSLSALVQEQIEGLTPLAISLIPEDKFATVFSQAQISAFTFEQASAVTQAQRSALSPVQATALSMVLNPWEDKPVDFRGRSLGVSVDSCSYFYLVYVLTLMLVL